MRNIKTVAISTTMILCSLTSAYGSPKSTTKIPAVQAEKTLKDVEGLASDLADRAFVLRQVALKQNASAMHQEGIAEMRSEVNRIGAGLRVLESERASLAPWEVKVLDQVLPMMSDVAATVTAGIHTYREHPNNLWFTAYIDETSTINKEASTVASLIKDSVRLSREIQDEHRLEQKLGSSPSF